MARYKLLGVSYKCRDGNTYNKGDTIESDRELDKVFVGMFEKLPDVVVIEKQQPDSLSSSKGGEESLASPPVERNVTKQFSIAKKVGGVKIIRITDGDKEYYNVVDSGNGQLHNGKPLKTPTKVKKFLTNLLPEESAVKEG